MSDSTVAVTQARRALGTRLALARKEAGITQHRLAAMVHYARTSIANIETGRQQAPRHFWQRCDEALGAGGDLAHAHDRLLELVRRSIATVDSPLSMDDDQTAADDSAVAATIEARRHRTAMSNVDATKLDYLEEATRRAILASETGPPAAIAARVRHLREHVSDLLAGGQHPPQRSRLYATAAYLSGLLGALALDQGQRRTAARYGLEAYELADAADDRHLRAWSRATQNLIAYYSERYHDALAWARDGQRWAGGGPQVVRLAINGEARALGKLGDVAGVDEAVDRAFTVLAEYPSPSQVSPSLSWDIYCPARTAATAATAYLAAGTAPGKVVQFAAQALAAFDLTDLRGPRALSRLDLATASLRADGDPERSCALVREAMVITADNRFHSVTQRTAEFLTEATPWAGDPSVTEVTELLGHLKSAAGRTVGRQLPSAHGHVRGEQPASTLAGVPGTGTAA